MQKNDINEKITVLNVDNLDNDELELIYECFRLIDSIFAEKSNFENLSEIFGEIYRIIYSNDIDDISFIKEFNILQHFVIIFGDDNDFFRETYENAYQVLTYLVKHYSMFRNMIDINSYIGIFSVLNNHTEIYTYQMGILGYFVKFCNDYSDMYKIIPFDIFMTKLFNNANILTSLGVSYLIVHIFEREQTLENSILTNYISRFFYNISLQAQINILRICINKLNHGIFNEEQINLIYKLCNNLLSSNLDNENDYIQGSNLAVSLMKATNNKLIFELDSTYKILMNNESNNVLIHASLHLVSYCTSFSSDVCNTIYSNGIYELLVSMALNYTMDIKYYLLLTLVSTIFRVDERAFPGILIRSRKNGLKVFEIVKMLMIYDIPDDIVLCIKCIERVFSLNVHTKNSEKIYNDFYEAFPGETIYHMTTLENCDYICTVLDNFLSTYFEYV